MTSNCSKIDFKFGLISEREFEQIIQKKVVSHQHNQWQFDNCESSQRGKEKIHHKGKTGTRGCLMMSKNVSTRHEKKFIAATYSFSLEASIIAKTRLDFGINIDLAPNTTYLQCQVRIIRREWRKVFKKAKTQLYE